MVSSPSQFSRWFQFKAHSHELHSIVHKDIDSILIFHITDPHQPKCKTAKVFFFFFFSNIIFDLLGRWYQKVYNRIFVALIFQFINVNRMVERDDWFLVDISCQRFSHIVGILVLKSEVLKQRALLLLSKN